MIAAEDKTISGRLYSCDCFDEISALNNQLVNMQRELNKKNVELEKANEFKNQFLGMVAHDLRNPMSAVITLSKFLIGDCADTISDKQWSFLLNIKSTTESMLNMVDQLLDISEIEAGKLSLNKETVDLTSLIEEYVYINRILSSKKKIAIEYNYEEGLPLIAVDRQKLGQVMNNLLCNAAKFSYPDSVIRVRTYREGGSIVTSVIDNGIGIHEHEIERLFKPFGKASGKGTAGEKGSGLGLTICHKIVEGHKGKITVESKYGAGSSFKVYIPIHNDL